MKKLRIIAIINSLPIATNLHENFQTLYIAEKFMPELFDENCGFFRIFSVEKGICVSNIWVAELTNIRNVENQDEKDCFVNRKRSIYY